MTRGDFNSKMRGMLDTTTYRRLKKDLYCNPGIQAELKTEGTGEGRGVVRASVPPAQAIWQPASQDLRPPEDPQG